MIIKSNFTWQKLYINNYVNNLKYNIIANMKIFLENKSVFNPPFLNYKVCI